MKEDKDYKEFILNHPVTLHAKDNVKMTHLIESKYLYDMFSGFASSETTAFIIEITDILSDDVKKILKEHGIGIGDIMYVSFNENIKSLDRATEINERINKTKQQILRDKEIDDDLKVKELLDLRAIPDYQTGKMELGERDKFFINDSIASKIIGNVYAVPEKVFKLFYVRNLAAEKEVELRYMALNMRPRIEWLKKCFDAVERYHSLQNEEETSALESAYNMSQQIEANKNINNKRNEEKEREM